jgi:hypothetical protein
MANVARFSEWILILINRRSHAPRPGAAGRQPVRAAKPPKKKALPERGKRAGLKSSTAVSPPDKKARGYNPALRSLSHVQISFHG